MKNFVDKGLFVIFDMAGLAAEIRQNSDAFLTLIGTTTLYRHSRCSVSSIRQRMYYLRSAK